MKIPVFLHAKKACKINRRTVGKSSFTVWHKCRSSDSQSTVTNALYFCLLSFPMTDFRQRKIKLSSAYGGSFRHGFAPCSLFTETWFLCHARHIFKDILNYIYFKIFYICLVYGRIISAPTLHNHRFAQGVNFTPAINRNCANAQGANFTPCELLKGWRACPMAYPIL